MLISAVARVFNPGCQVDTVLILIGPTGLGKSSVFQILGAPWYSNTIAALSSEAAREQTQGTWIHELAELDAVHRAEWSAILNFISTREDKFRMKFQRRSAIYKRQCVFVGSTEQEDWLRDLSGHRRWWPVRCFSIDLEALAEAKAQLWAEALVRYFAQERWYLFEPELIGDARAAVEAVITVDEWESYILPFVAARPFVLVTDICNECLQIPRERQTLPTFLRIARILSPLGWQRKAIRILDDRGKSHLSKVWVNPKNLDEY
jgi:putative DNA primase/helicase